jgi:hypothetical protein
MRRALVLWTVPGDDAGADPAYTASKKEIRLRIHQRPGDIETNQTLIASDLKRLRKLPVIYDQGFRGARCPIDGLSEQR